jgi:hypothetical protein
MKEPTERKSTNPGWITPRGAIDEVKFCQDFRLQHDVIYDHGKFYGIDGCITDETKLRQDIYRLIAPYATTHVQQQVDRLMATWRTCWKKRIFSLCSTASI